MTIGEYLLMGVGGDGIGFVGATSSTPAGNPQLQYFENFENKNGSVNAAYSNGTLSVHAVNIPLSLSFNYPNVLLSHNSGSFTVQFGLYSKNANTLSLANSASVALTAGAAYSWFSMATSATQNITPGAWYFALNILSAGSSSLSFLANSSLNPANAQPFLIAGRMTASTNAIPSSIATSALDISGSDASRQPYIIITA